MFFACVARLFKITIHPSTYSSSLHSFHFCSLLPKTREQKSYFYYLHVAPRASPVLRSWPYHQAIARGSASRLQPAVPGMPVFLTVAASDWPAPIMQVQNSPTQILVPWTLHGVWPIC